jgi:putative nucleotidyltransferase with HDIG domain
MIDLQQVIRAAHDLDPLPASATRLAELVEDADAGVEQIAEVIAFDQALTMKMLRAANSAASASALEVTNVHEAVARMGAAQVVAFAMASHTKSMLAKAVPGYGLSENQLWRHSVLSALAAEAMPRACRVAVPPDAFTAALLHDIGKLVLNRFLTPPIVELIHRAQTEGRLSPFEAEVEVIQVHHAEVGGLVAQHWGLPERIVKAIQYHHDPEHGDDDLCAIVYVANKAANKIEPMLPGMQPEHLQLNPTIVERLQLGATALDDLCEAAAKRFEDVSARYATA